MKLPKFLNKTVYEIPAHLFVLILVDRGVLADRVLAVLHLFHLGQEGAMTTFHVRCSFPRKRDRQIVIERRQPPLVYRERVPSPGRLSDGAGTKFLSYP